MSLDPNPARPLTSREIAKVVGAVMGGFVTWCGSQAVTDALDHMIEHRSGYIEEWKIIEGMAQFENLLDNPPRADGEKK